MSEFKFACPVCGQHITADSSTAGSQLECPTCFQKIVVPQGPTAGDSKLILSAAQASKPRPTSIEATSDLGPLRRSRGRSLVSTAATLLVLLGAVAAAFFWRAEILKAVRRLTPLLASKAEKPAPADAPQVVHASPAQVKWTLDVTNAVIPKTPVAGRVNGHEFVCDQPTLLGGALLLRQGEIWPPEFGVGILLFARQAEELSGKTVLVTPNQAAGAPPVILRWKEDQAQAISKTITNGYALKVVFGQAANGRMPGKVYIALPDEAKSVAAGTFDAEIRQPDPARPHRARPQPTP
jgi:DNA-directed RNA polymerase subunit RPC12/RpoP